MNTKTSRVGLNDVKEGDTVGLCGINYRWREAVVTRVTVQQVVIGQTRFWKDDGEEVKTGWRKDHVAHLDHILDNRHGITVRQTIVLHREERERLDRIGAAARRIESIRLRDLSADSLEAIVAIIEADEHRWAEELQAEIEAERSA